VPGIYYESKEYETGEGKQTITFNGIWRDA